MDDCIKELQEELEYCATREKYFTSVKDAEFAAYYTGRVEGIRLALSLLGKLP